MAQNTFSFGGGGGTGTNPFGQPQQQQQQQQQQGAPGAGLFGAPPGGNMFGAGGGGGGGLFNNAPQQQAQPSLFGQPQQQQQGGTTGGGIFGQPAAGGGGAFGGGGTGGIFGQAQNNASAGGNAFGQPARPGFGAASGGLFGSGGATQNAFGTNSNTAPTAFGAPSTNTGAFGSSSTGGMFGAAKPATTLGFGGTQTAGGGLFGGNNAAAGAIGTNAFGAQNNLGVQQPGGVPPAGSATEPYAPVREKEGTGQNVSWCNYHSISVMPTYKGCNFEELRLNDYLAGRKTAAPALGAFSGGGAFGGFGQQPQQQQSVAFGQQQPAAGGFSFGQQQQPAAGGGLFGAQNAAAPATNAFGQPQAQAGGGLFGGQQQQPSAGGLFGQPQQQQQPAAQTSLFGQPQQQQQQAGGNIFGNPAAASNQLAAGTGSGAFGSAFGAAQQPKPAGFAFGNSAPAASTSVFGAPQAAAPSGGLFGGGSTSAFGQPAGAAAPATNSFAFGSNQPAAAPSLFGQPAANTQQPAPNAFGAAAPAGGLFGSTAAPAAAPSTFSFGKTSTPPPAATGGLFGGGGAFGASTAPAQPGGLFGSTQNGQTNAQPGAGLFGASAGQGLFGQAQGSQNPTGGLFGQINAQSASGQGAVGAGLGNSSFGQSQGPGGNVFGNNASNFQPQTLTQSVLGSSNPLGGSQNSRIAVNINSPDPYGISLFENNPGFANINTIKALPPPLGTPLRKPALPSYDIKRSQLRQSTSSAFPSPGYSGGRTSAYGGNRNGTSSPGVGLFDSPISNGVPANIFTPRQSVKKLVIEKPITHKQLAPTASRVQLAQSRSAAADRDSESNAGETATSRTPDKRGTPAREPGATGRPGRTRQTPPDINFSEMQTGDYWTWPKLNDLSNMGADELKSVSGFIVGRQGFGRVSFTCPVDLSTVEELKTIPGSLVTFDHMSCEVYPDAETALSPGEGLNHPAEIELEKVWVKSKASKEEIKDPANPAVEKFIRKLQNTKDTKFVSYDISKGLWVFRVEHFTRYGVDDDEDEEAADSTDGMPHRSKSVRPMEQKGSPAQDDEPDTKKEKDDDGEDNESFSAMKMAESLSDTHSSLSTSTIRQAGGMKRAALSIRGHGEGLKRGAASIDADFGEAGMDQLEVFDSAAVERSTFGAQSQPHGKLVNFNPDPSNVYPARKYIKVPMKDSLLNGHEGNGKNALAAFGRSSRGSWTAQHYASASSVSVDIRPIATQSLASALELIATQQDHSDLQLLDGVPLFTVSESLRFRDFAAIFATHKDGAANLWRLGHALFDEIALPAVAPAESVPLAVDNIARKAAFSRWLEDSVGQEVEREASNLDPGPAKVFSLLSGHQLEEAVDAAITSGDLRLSLLVAQLGGGDEFRSLMASQLSGWQAEGADQHMSKDVKRVYSLLAGQVDSIKGAARSHTEDGSVSEGLPWQRALGLDLWYASGFQTPLEDVIAGFAERQGENGRPRITSSAGVTTKDALFTLLEVFSKLETDLENLLDPRTLGQAIEDVSTQWHLFMLLTRVFGLGKGRSECLASRLTLDYASQLEAAGLWAEAIFISLHLAESHARVKAVREILFRQPPSAFAVKGMTRRLVHDLKIPSNWLAEAEANVLHASGDVYAEYRSCLQAGLFNRAHELLVQELVPELVLHQDIEKAKQMLADLQNERVASWDVGGQVIADYITCHERIPALCSALAHDESRDPEHADELHDYYQRLLRVNAELPRMFNNSKERPMGMYQKAALRQLLADVQRLLAEMPRAPAPEVLPEADRLRLISTASRHSFLQKLELACE